MFCAGVGSEAEADATWGNWGSSDADDDGATEHVSTEYSQGAIILRRQEEQEENWYRDSSHQVKKNSVEREHRSVLSYACERRIHGRVSRPWGKENRVCVAKL